jgi:hypothetical protein
MTSESVGLGQEPEGTPRRYHVAVSVVLNVFVDAGDSHQASSAARLAALGVLDTMKMDGSGVKYLGFGRTPPPSQVWVGDEIRPLPATAPPHERSVHLYRICFAHDGPHLTPDEDIIAEIRAIWPLLDEAERLEAYGAWSAKGIDPSAGTSERFRLRRQDFSGEWDPDTSWPGYTGGHKWNGWEVPYFPRQVLDDIVAGAPNARIVEKPDGAVEFVFDDPDLSFTLTPATYLTEDGLQKLYKFDGGWCWDVATPSPADDDSDESDELDS